MKRCSKLFILSALFLAVFTFITIAIDSHDAGAQGTPGKSKSTKMTDQSSAKSDKVSVTFVEIGSVNCIPCKAMQPIMKAIEDEYKGQVKIVFHDVWTSKGKDDAAKYNIRIIPTQVFLDKNGKEYFRHEGYFPKIDVVRVLQMQGIK